MGQNLRRWPRTILTKPGAADGHRIKALDYKKFQVDVPILSNSECNNLFKLAALDEHVSEDIWVCAGYREGGKDACDVSTYFF